MSSSKGSRGTLDKTPIAQVMAYIYRRELNGTLVIKYTESGAESKEYNIFFIKGMPSYVGGKGLGHPVGEIFVESGLITSDELDHYLQVARESKIICGQYLLQNGIVDKRQLETAIRIQIRKRIKDIFTVFRGDFVFHPDENITGLLSEHMVPTNLPAILPESLRLTWSGEQLQSKLESIREHKFSVADYESCRKTYGWSRTETAALEHLNAKIWTLGRLELTVSDRMRDFRIVIYTLLLTGRLNFDEGADEEEARMKDEERKRKLETMYNMMQAKLQQIQEGNYFDLLEVKIDVGVDEIRDNYMRLLKDYHPDRVEQLKDDRLREGFEKISMNVKEAMEVLSDSDARKKYEMHIAGKTDGSKEEEEIVRQTLSDELAYQKAIVLLNKRNWREIITLLEPVVKRGTENGDYLAAYAWSRISMAPENEPVTEWVNMLRKAVGLAGRSERANFYLALALQREGKLSEYASYIEITVDINPYNIEAKRRLHIIKTRKKKEKKSFLGAVEKSGLGDRLKGFLKKK